MASTSPTSRYSARSASDDGDIHIQAEKRDTLTGIGVDDRRKRRVPVPPLVLERPLAEWLVRLESHAEFGACLDVDRSGQIGFVVDRDPLGDDDGLVRRYRASDRRRDTGSATSNARERGLHDSIGPSVQIEDLPSVRHLLAIDSRGGHSGIRVKSIEDAVTPR